MSDEEIFINSDDNESSNNMEIESNNEEKEEKKKENKEIEAPEIIYQRAKDNLGFNDDEASEDFILVYNSENANDLLRIKALNRAILILSSTSDFNILI